MIGLAIVLTLITLIVVVGVFIYYLFYLNQINKRIREGEVQGRRLVDIPKIVMAAVIILLILYSITLSVSLKQEKAARMIVNRDNVALINTDDYKYISRFGMPEDDDASVYRIFSKDGIEGYTKNVSKDGDFIFTTFTAKDGKVSMMPDYLCFVDCMGDTEGLSFYTKMGFCKAESDSGSSIGSGGADIPKHMLIVGNINDGEIFSFTVALLDEEAETAYREAERAAYKADKGEFPNMADYAGSSGRVEISR